MHIWNGEKGEVIKKLINYIKQRIDAAWFVNKKTIEIKIESI